MAGTLGASSRTYAPKHLVRELQTEIADAIVPEWRELRLRVEPTEEVEPKSEKVEEVRFGEQPAEKYDSLWCFTFRNYLGKSVIRVKFADGREVVTDPIEVVSPKTPLDLDKETDPLFYPKFLSALIEDLLRYLVSLPFDWAAPTEFMTKEEAQPPSLIFVLHVLAQYADTIRYALQTILRNPHRRLVTEERWARLDEASSVDADTVLMMLQHPEFLHPYRGGALTALASRLKDKVPERVFERRVTETLDTPENRFIKRFMDIVLYWCDELEGQGYWEKVASHKTELSDLRDFVRFVRADPLFADVGEMEIFPASSQVLLRRDGYRECLQIYRLLHMARVPIFDRIQDAIDNRRIDQLYEFWCFFKLAEELAKILGNGQRPRISTLESDESGLRHGVSANLGNGYQLIYNQQFKSQKADEGYKTFSYSVPLRPDFSLMRCGQLKVAFDAKFRFDERDISQLGKSLEQLMDEAQQKGDVERLAKHADICKMHTYRDALKCQAAVVLFPGTEGNGIFYDKRQGKIDCRVTFRAIISHVAKRCDWQGVGAIPVVPELEGGEQDG